MSLCEMVNTNIVHVFCTEFRKLALETHNVASHMCWWIAPHINILMVLRGKVTCHFRMALASKNGAVITCVPDVVHAVIWQFANEVGVSYSLHKFILADDLGMWKVLANDQKHHMISWLSTHTTKDLNFLSNIITGDESWIYTWHVEMKHLHPSSLHPKKHSRCNKMLMSWWHFFDHKGLLYLMSHRLVA
jgi:hypothetical protein